MIFLSYVMLGISLAAPVGPVNAAQVEKGMTRGFMHSWIVGIGAMVGDAVYMLAVFLGVLQFLEFEAVKVFLWLFGGFVLIYTGFESIKQNRQSSEELVTTRRGSESLWKSFRTGFFISLLNPLTILFWLGIYGSVLAKTVTLYSVSEIWLYSGAIFLGIASWDLILASLSSTARLFMKQKALTNVSFISGLCLIGFGVYFGFNALQMLFT